MKNLIPYCSRIVYRHIKEDMTFVSKAEGAGHAVDQEMGFAITLRNNMITEVRIVLNCEDEDSV